MAVRVLEIEATPTVVAVDLAFLGARGIGPIDKALLLDAAENLVELRLAHQKGEVARQDFPFAVHEVEIDAVRSRNDLERAPLPGLRQTQDAGEESRRAFAVA